MILSQDMNFQDFRIYIRLYPNQSSNNFYSFKTLNFSVWNRLKGRKKNKKNIGMSVLFAVMSSKSRLSCWPIRVSCFFIIKKLPIFYCLIRISNMWSVPTIQHMNLASRYFQFIVKCWLRQKMPRISSFFFIIWKEQCKDWNSGRLNLKPHPLYEATIKLRW